MKDNNEDFPIPTMGEFLKEGFLDEMNLSQQDLSNATGISKSQISKILNDKMALTAEKSILLDKFFCKSEGFFLRAQNSLDLKRAKRTIKDKLDKVKPYILGNRSAQEQAA